MTDADAIVIGAGVNGLVAAIKLADAGWSVELLEAAPDIGGACRSSDSVTAPGFVTDLYSAFYPLGVASPVLGSLGLAAHGLEWSHAPAVLAHPLLDGPTALLSRDVSVTAASLDAFAPGDGDAWRDTYAGWLRVRDPLLATLFGTFPPVASALRLAKVLGPAGLLRFARFGVLPVRQFGRETFGGAGGSLLLTGNAMHTDLTPDSAGTAVFGWLLAMLGQEVGWPVPVGGAGVLTQALGSRARAAGVRITTGARVSRIAVRGGRAAGVVLADGSSAGASRAVIADIDAPQLLLSMVGASHLPDRMVSDLGKFDWDNATVKVDWALSGPIPWSDPAVAGAGTVHLGGSMSDLTQLGADLANRMVPRRPFALLGQMTTSDSTRSPAGTESAWAYAHVPQQPVGDAGSRRALRGGWAAADVARVVERIEAAVEAQAPGFTSLILARHVAGPLDLQEANGALHFGALNGGTAAVHQQLVFRPTPGLGRPETPIRGLYLGGMSAHPSGGVHGAAGANAAAAALSAAGLLGPVREAAVHAAMRALVG